MLTSRHGQGRAYTIIPGTETSSKSADGQLIDKFVALYTISRRKCRTWLILGGAVLVLVIVFSQQTCLVLSRSQANGHFNPVHFNHLTIPFTEGAVDIDNETVIVGEHHAVLGNFPDDYQWIDSDSRQPFAKTMLTNGMNNNAMGRMPAGSPYEMLVVARGRSGKYMDPTENIPYVNLTLVGFFVNFNPVIERWERVGPEPYILDLPVWRQFPRPCKNLVNGGPADPRFIWSDAGEPLAVIGTSSRVKGICKAIGLVDLRAVWPDLKEHLEYIGYGAIPIKFNNFTEIGRANSREPYEKNWAAFFPGPKPATRELPWYRALFASWITRLPISTWPLFASRVAPRSILEVDSTIATKHASPGSYVLAKSINLSIPVNGTLSVADSQCLEHSLPRTWHAGFLHQATPFYRVTLCLRGRCSVEIDQDVVFSVSLAFLPTKSAKLIAKGVSPFARSTDVPGGYLNHGWLDDTLVVGAGLRDEMYDGIHLPMHERELPTSQV
ncbi:hypothetical protein NM208_g7379 [Fusarium decemcellulare]|uniref:Uncharacterized protein n=1 Tax=Fusarium decemcellulare TaxID=57161 RepID=A0ACC1S9K1_9HYPO|nr:hypothetical protein NM208_g7379 [Fusarium decemcellulare]